MTPVEQIKERLSIVDVVGSYIKLTKAGSSYKAVCPFHNEKTPSFNVSPAREAFYCFGCQKGGDIFTFVEEIEGVQFPEALKILAARAGVELRRDERADAERSERERLFLVMEAAAEFYVSEGKKNPAVGEYLRGRGLTEKTIADFDIGYAPNDWRTCLDHLKGKGFTDGEIERAGLIKYPDDTAARGGAPTSAGGAKRPYDRFRGRVMFPIHDGNGRTIAFTGRIFGHQKNKDGSEPAKYINSPEGPLYDKSVALYGFDRAKTHIRKQNFAVLVEGQMDLIMAHQAGVENAVAVSGTALTEKHLTHLKRLTDNLVFAFDADDAGLAATARAFRLALSLGMNVRVAAIPDGKDPADYILLYPEGFSAVVSSSTHIIDFYLATLAKRGNDPDRFREDVKTKVLPLVIALQSKIEAAHYVVEVARMLGVPENAVWEDVSRLAAAEKTIESSIRAAIEPKSAAKVRSRRQVAEEEIIGILSWQESHKNPVLDVGAARKSYAERVAFHGMTPWEPAPEYEQIFAFRAEQTYPHEPTLADIVEEILDTLEREILKEKQAELLREIIRAEAASDKEASTEHIKIYKLITPRLIELENKKNKVGN